MKRRETTPEERKKMIEEFCKVDEEKSRLVHKLNDGFNKLFAEMLNRRMDFDEYYKRFDEIVKSDEHFTLEFLKPKSYQYSELFPIKLQELICDENIPLDREIIYRIYYLNSLFDKTSKETIDFANETVRMIEEENKRG